MAQADLTAVWILIASLAIAPISLAIYRRRPWHSYVVDFMVFLSLTWLCLTNAKVREPYLDEFFHVPQAVKYLEGKWRDWDDKITTPPGLYIVSYLIVRIIELLRHWALFAIASLVVELPRTSTVTSDLRSTNVAAIIAVSVLATRCMHLISSHHQASARGSSATSTKQRDQDDKSSPPRAAHAGANIALFPVLFFFSGVYYTDVWSTVSVLWAYRNHLQRVATPNSRPSPISDALTVLYGVMALLMRQTNVFWVVVYFGGLEAVHAIKAVGLADPSAADKKLFRDRDFTDNVSAAKAYLQLYASGHIHDPPLNSASFYDVIWLAISVAVAAVCNVPRVLRQVWPHVTILALFGGFVAWNGGVVLGDKSNHIATLHLPQMLYIWPLFMFFSAPLLLSLVKPALASLRDLVGGQPCPQRTTTKGHDHQHRRPPSSLRLLQSLAEHCRSGIVPMWYISLPLAAAIVWSGTIVHPFTLADNRHYMFYVFRYTIRRPIVRCLLVPVYVVCHRLCWRLLCGSEDSQAHLLQRQRRWFNAPFSSPRTNIAKSSSSSTPATATGSQGAVQPLSTAVFWLLATALSLITAPLVEPRYFIVPWVMWRLLLPAWEATEVGRGRFWNFKVDLLLVAETLWFVAVNVATMYLFLYRPYQWRDADGKLMDEGRLQRFMW